MGTGVDRLRGEPSVLGPLGAFGAAVGLLFDGRAVLELGLLLVLILLVFVFVAPARVV